MARRRNRWMDPGLPAPRSSMGDNHIDTAKSRITTLCQRSVAAMIRRPFTLNQIIHMMFEPDIIRRATEAKGAVDDQFLKTESYRLYAHRYGSFSYINLTYENEPMLAIWDKAYKYSARQEPMLQFIDEVYAIYKRFEEVRALMVWLNRNATAGAIRYYFPTAMKLTPEAPCWKGLDDVPSRYHEPAGIGDWIQIIKDATNNMAASALLPADIQKTNVTGVSLTFGATEVAVTERTKYTTTALTFNV